MTKKSMKAKIGGTVLALTIMATSMNVFAGTTYSGFSFNLPGFNGSKTTANQTKTTTGASGDIKNYKSGAKANVDARMIDADGDAGPWTRNLNQNSSTYSLDGRSNQKAGEKIAAEFSSDITTTVGVDISGDWRSN